jgi:hypothetical protein
LASTTECGVEITNRPAKGDEMYIGLVGADQTERHISLVPYFPDIEAICGQRVTATYGTPWRDALSITTCPRCRTQCHRLAQKIIVDELKRGLRNHRIPGSSVARRLHGGEQKAELEQSAG